MGSPPRIQLGRVRELRSNFNVYSGKSPPALFHRPKHKIGLGEEVASRRQRGCRHHARCYAILPNDREWNGTGVCNAEIINEQLRLQEKLRRYQGLPRQNSAWYPQDLVRQASPPSVAKIVRRDRKCWRPRRGFAASRREIWRRREDRHTRCTAGREENPDHNLPCCGCCPGNTEISLHTKLLVQKSRPILNVVLNVLH